MFDGPGGVKTRLRRAEKLFPRGGRQPLTPAHRPGASEHLGVFPLAWDPEGIAQAGVAHQQSWGSCVRGRGCLLAPCPFPRTWGAGSAGPWDCCARGPRGGSPCGQSPSFLSGLLRLTLSSCAQQSCPSCLPTFARSSWGRQVPSAVSTPSF